jgi:hypothetical protein
MLATLGTHVFMGNKKDEFVILWRVKVLFTHLTTTAPAIGAQAVVITSTESNL